MFCGWVGILAFVCARSFSAVVLLSLIERGSSFSCFWWLGSGTGMIIAVRCCAVSRCLSLFNRTRVPEVTWLWVVLFYTRRYPGGVKRNLDIEHKFLLFSAILVHTPSLSLSGSSTVHMIVPCYWQETDLALRNPPLCCNVWNGVRNSHMKVLVLRGFGAEHWSSTKIPMSHDAGDGGGGDDDDDDSVNDDDDSVNDDDDIGDNVVIMMMLTVTILLQSKALRNDPMCIFLFLLVVSFWSQANEILGWSYSANENAALDVIPSSRISTPAGRDGF